MPASPSSDAPQVSRPAIPLPSGACDTHSHVFGPADRFPQAPGFAYDPPHAPYDAHAATRATLGVGRGVLIQPGIYDQDCSAILDAIARSGGALRGIASKAADVSDAELARLHAGGIRGLRFVEVPDPKSGGRYKGSVGFDTLDTLAPRMRDLGWVAEVWADCDRLVADAPLLRSLGLPVVIEHMGRFDVSRGVDDPSFRALVDLLSEGWAWVKLAVCRASQRVPDYDDVRPYHDRLAAAAPDRLLWGSDWPYVRLGPKPPDAGHLVDLFDRWTGGDPGLRHKVFVDNPQTLFGFDPL